ncbi:hypothetical protein FA15DRAFT_432160 [Coprinopsis marcescibilis]|uniref:Secreted protein n=1 Tax=Coprinopsis marcescibilis TaxID=230819 RepID=A0A5C3KVD5_COPMA|nr:hypothetical protein FA15DRAFT_432160 [Coprinopsis marcescibilis]
MSSSSFLLLCGLLVRIILPSSSGRKILEPTYKKPRFRAPMSFNNSPRLQGLHSTHVHVQSGRIRRCGRLDISLPFGVRPTSGQHTPWAPQTQQIQYMRWVTKSFKTRKDRLSVLDHPTPGWLLSFPPSSPGPIRLPFFLTLDMLIRVVRCRRLRITGLKARIKA